MVKNNKIIDVMEEDKLKQLIVEQVNLIKSVETLKDLLAILEYNAIPVVTGDKLAEEQLRLLDEAESEIERGECNTWEDVKREMDQWLKEA